MKKREAKIIAIDKSRLMMEYLNQILTDDRKVHASMEFLPAKVNNQSVFILDINVPEAGFSKQIDLEMPILHNMVLYEQVLNDLLDTFLEHETIGITRYYSIKSARCHFTGIDVFNSENSRIRINFHGSGTEFNHLIDNYQKRYQDFVESLENQPSQYVKRK